MCGIAGMMVRGGRAPDRAALDRMESALFHRGPDSNGQFVQGPVGLGETRLAIVDVAHGQQPLYGPAGAVLVANGEIYNAPELRAEMGEDRFKTHSDCEPPVHLYEQVGIDFAERLRGMYAIAIYDPARDRLVLSRDPYGIKPLYYVQTPEVFAFASEPQALIRAGLVQPKVDPARRDELLQLKYTTGEDTIFEGIERVAPGETLAIEDGEIVDRRRLPMVEARPERIARASALEAFGAVMSDSVAVHLRTDVPYGLFLSGGIDSSILLVLMQRLSQTPIQALTLGYPGRDPGDESWTALELARASGAECRRIEMTPEDFWAFAPRIAAAIDDPTADPAVLPTWMLGRAAREQGLKVTLCGEGADEWFGGYSRYRRAKLPRIKLGRSRRRGVFSHTPGMEGRFNGWESGIEAARRREKANASNHMGVVQAVDCAERLPNGLLIKLDRCLMANSVEGRTPFLDRRVTAFAAGLPDDLKVSLKFGKVLLREWLAKNSPAARPYARKMGFNPPVGGWMAGRSEELARLVSAQPAVAELFSPDLVQTVFAAAGERAQPAWSLLFYALWHSHNVMGLSTDGDIGQVLNEAARG